MKDTTSVWCTHCQSFDSPHVHEIPRYNGYKSVRLVPGNDDILTFTLKV